MIDEEVVQQRVKHFIRERHFTRNKGLKNRSQFKNLRYRIEEIREVDVESKWSYSGLQTAR